MRAFRKNILLLLLMASPLHAPAFTTDHDAHHSINTGNFGSFLNLWDRVFGTAIPDATVESVIYSKKKA